LKPQGGSGLLVPGVPGTYPAKVVVLGGGVAGTNAASVAVGLGADVTVLDTNVGRLRELDALYAGRIKTIASTAFEVERAVLDADLVVGSVLVPGAKAPKLVRNDMVARMRAGSVLVDIAVDQGGCFEDSHPTTHDAPTFRVHDTVFYCVANMPGAVPHTSTHALTNATLPYMRAIANNGWKSALQADPSLAHGLNVVGGTVTNAGVAEANGVQAATLESALA
jgi:alanine dehydrogenase